MQTLQHSTEITGELEPVKSSVRYNRGDLGAMIKAAARLSITNGKPYYIFGTYYGFTLEVSKPPCQHHYKIDGRKVEYWA